MTFNIGSQHAANINNVAGNMYVTGGQRGLLVTGDAARHAAHDLRIAVAAAGSDAATTDAAEIEAGVAAEQPDRPRLAGMLERLTRLLTSTGAFVTAGAALVTPLQALAVWLGTLGAPVLGLLAPFT